MREIKFRAWDPHRKEMLHNEFHLCSDGTLYSFGPAPQLILMQFTGLKDKNGMEIYEGDVLVWHYEFGASEKPLSKRLTVEMPNIYYTLENDSCPPFETGKECAIIGNIYENPGLLKEKT